MLQTIKMQGVARPEETGLGYRMLFAIIGLFAGEATMAVLVRGQPLWLYYIGSVAIGWAFVGLPLVLPLAPSLVSQMPWPLVLIAGCCLSLGPGWYFRYNGNASGPSGSGQVVVRRLVCWHRTAVANGEPGFHCFSGDVLGFSASEVKRVSLPYGTFTLTWRTALKARLALALPKFRSSPG